MTTSTTAAPKVGHDYLMQLDGLRFVAVALVLYDHWLAEKNSLPFGALGVNLFFVLSGFLITRILMVSKQKTKEQPNGLGQYLKKFYIRRTLRIFPIYYLSILALWLLQDPSVVGKLKWSLLYATNIYIAHYETWLGVIDHYWSLAVEEQFYIFFPILVFFIPRRYLLSFFVSMFLLSFGVRFYLFFSHTNWVVSYVSTVTCLDAFGLGAIMAYLNFHHKAFFVRLFTNRWWLVLSFLAMVGVVIWEESYTELHTIANDVWERGVASVFFFFLIGGAIVGYKGIGRWLLENPVSNYLGRISYGIYIYHNFVYNYYHSSAQHPVVRLMAKLPILNEYDALRLGLLFAIVVAVASVSWYVIEKPINDLKDKWAA